MISHLKVLFKLLGKYEDRTKKVTGLTLCAWRTWGQYSCHLADLKRFTPRILRDRCRITKDIYSHFLCRVSIHTSKDNIYKVSKILWCLDSLNNCSNIVSLCLCLLLIYINKSEWRLWLRISKTVSSCVSIRFTQTNCDLCERPSLLAYIMHCITKLSCWKWLPSYTHLYLGFNSKQNRYLVTRMRHLHLPQ